MSGCVREWVCTSVGGCLYMYVCGVWCVFIPVH